MNNQKQSCICGKEGLYATDLGRLCDSCYKEELNRRQQEVTNSLVDDAIEFSYHDHMERGGYTI